MFLVFISIWEESILSFEVVRSGHFFFSVKASGNGENWVNASNPVAFHIVTPWWRQSWFLTVSMVLAGGIILLIIRRRNKKIHQQQEDLETEQAINYLATFLHEQTTVEAILWDVAKNCIGRLRFEDCVIYLKDEERNVLIQKAAWGPKTTEDNKIVNPIEFQCTKA